MKKIIPFNKPHIPKNTEAYVIEAIRSGKHCGNHSWNQKCIQFLKDRFGFHDVFMVPSGTAALEMGCILGGLEPGDEAIMPSYTFSSTATSVIMNGAKPVFCEIEPNTMNIDPDRIEELITPKTKMIIPIDYAGIPCDIEKVQSIADKYNLTVMVDAAQSLNSKDKNGNWVGSVSPLSAFSFHETKNFGCGEGGALVVNKEDWIQRAHFVQEKGTDRRLVLDGVQSKYGWVDKGSSYLLSDILAAMLYAQFEEMDSMHEYRSRITKAYNELYSDFENKGYLRVPHPPKGSTLNHHAFFVIFDTKENRQRFLSKLKEEYSVNAYIGYVALHSFKKGIQMGYKPEDLPITEDLAGRVVRLPFYTELGKNISDLEYTIESMKKVLIELY